MSRRIMGLLSAAGAVGILLFFTAPTAATAAPIDGYADWTVTGSAGAYSGSLDLSAGFPGTTFTSNAQTVTVSAGTSAYLPSGTPFADAYGVSQGRSYISVSPAANNAASPSTTTFTFDSPAPSGTWGISLGDVDAETVTVLGTTAGRPATAAELGLQGGYNYCDASPRPSTCSGLPAQGNVVPDVTAAGSLITATDPLCPVDQTRCNTTGASAWISPTVPLDSLTVVSTWKSGIPALQLWFATLTDGVAGTVLSDCATALPTTVELTVPPGAGAATAAVDTDGTFSFPQVVPRGDYTLRATGAPAGVEITESPVDFAATTPLTLTATALLPVEGRLQGPSDLVADRPVQLTGPRDRTVSTDATGAFRFDGLPSGTYALTIDTSDGAILAPAAQTVEVGCAAVTLAPLAIQPVPVPDPSVSPTPTATPTTAPSPSTTAVPAAGPRGSLPATGSEAPILGLWVGLGLALVGGVIHLVFGRRPASKS